MPRWKQRFENFEKAYFLLKEVFDEKPLHGYSALEKEGIVQRFEFTFELAWKTLKDYLVFSGVELEHLTPRHVIKAAFRAEILKDGQIWIDMLEDRNLLAHVYDRKKADDGLETIQTTYLPAIAMLHTLFKEKI